MFLVFLPGDVLPDGGIVGLVRVHFEGRIWIHADKVVEAERHGWQRTGVVAFDRALFQVWR